VMARSLSRFPGVMGAAASPLPLDAPHNAPQMALVIGAAPDEERLDAKAAVDQELACLLRCARRVGRRDEEAVPVYDQGACGGACASYSEVDLRS
jgi:hypothetical protein